MPPPAWKRLPAAGLRRVCRHCGKEYWIRARKPHPYCSHRCYNDHRTLPAVSCECCGKNMGGKKAPTTTGRARFCSYKCRHLVLRRENHPNWTGGRRVDKLGYVTVNVDGRGRVREHRLVAEQILGRPLQPREQVHHRNGNRLDNKPENLVVLTDEEHARAHKVACFQCPRCGWRMGDGTPPDLTPVSDVAKRRPTEQR